MRFTSGNSPRIADAIRKRYRVAEPSVVQMVVSRWFETPAGRATLEAERAACRRLPAAPGFRLMHLGVAPGTGVAECFPQTTRYSLAAAPAPDAAAVVAFDALPLPSDTLDVVVLHHALDFARYPHQVLVEAARTLRPGGRLVLVGFDPYSSFGVAKWLISPLRQQSVWRHNSLRRSRLVDWLALLGFAVDAPQRVTTGWQRSLDGRGGRAYVITAAKRVAPLRPLHHRTWLRGAALLGAGAGRARVRVAADHRRR